MNSGLTKMEVELIRAVFLRNQEIKKVDIVFKYL